MKGKHSLNEALETANKFLKEMQPLFSHFDICGSVRRGEAFVGDIDIVYITKNPYNADVEIMTIREKITELADHVIIIGDVKQRIMFKGMQIDLVRTIPECLGACLLHCTGSKDFNILCRGKAKKKEMKLNEYGLHYQPGIRVAEEEHEILLALGLESYTDPGRRNVEFGR